MALFVTNLPQFGPGGRLLAQSLFPVKQTKSPQRALASISSHFQVSLVCVNILILLKPQLLQNMVTSYDSGSAAVYYTSQNR